MDVKALIETIGGQHLLKKLLTEKNCPDIVRVCFGAVAQLGERLNGIQEVVSSILISSTKSQKGLRQRKPFFHFPIDF
jgi:hypothetical protein